MEKDIAEHGLARVYDMWYQNKEAHWEQAPGKQVLINALKVCCVTSQPLRVIDIGCGTGSLLARISQEVSNHWRLCGVDFSSVAVEQARKRYRDIEFMCADATSLDLESETCDIVTCYGSWEHFENPESAIAEAGRILRPGGWIFAMIPVLGIHRTDRQDEGWYEDSEVEGANYKQPQWNLKRAAWTRMFEQAGIQLLADSFAYRCGAHEPGVFFFGVKLAGELGPDAKPGGSPSSLSQNLFELGYLANVMSYTHRDVVKGAAKVVLNSLLEGNKVLVCGNGGSAADAQHFAAELVGKMARQRRALPAISLAADPSVVTALANDYGYDNVFARQVEGLGKTGDMLVVISTSGHSANVLKALETAQKIGLRTIALVGEGGDPALDNCDVCIHVPSSNAQRIQELHTAILHAICDYVEARIDLSPEEIRGGDQ